MALVSYGSSDSEEETEYLEAKSDAEKLNLGNKKIEDQLNDGLKSDHVNNPNDHQDNSFYKDLNEDKFSNYDLKETSHNHLKLPKPSSNVKSKLINLTTNKDKGLNKVKVFLPSYKSSAAEDDVNEEDEREFKRFKYSNSKGSGLKSILPPPTNQTKSSSKSISFVPDVLKRTVEKKPIKLLVGKTVEDEDNDNESINFFTFDQDEDNKFNNKHLSSEIKPNVELNKFETNLIENTFDRSFKNSSSNHSLNSTNSLNSETDYQKERKLKYIIEKKFGEQVGDEIKIQEVNIANHLNENLDYLKTLSEEKEQGIKGPAPSSTAKRKNQITYLAYQAKQNELKLKNEWAQGKINRDQSRSKYGF